VGQRFDMSGVRGDGVIGGLPWWQRPSPLASPGSDRITRT